jgi:thiamine-phosphate pyrophosphorylase
MPAKNHLSKNKKSAFICDSYRIIDANFNRSKEGLRVCEEILRFHLKDAPLTGKFRNLRHELTRLIMASALNQYLLFHERQAHDDLGRTFEASGPQKSFKEIFMCNAQRTKEALRVLEEFLKLFDTSASKNIQVLRFGFYALEKKCVKKFPALLNSR